MEQPAEPPEEGLEASLQERKSGRHCHNNHHYYSAAAITTDEMPSSDESVHLDGATTRVYLDNDEGGEDEWTISGVNPGGEIQDLDAKLVDPDIGNALNSFINAQDDEIQPHDLPNTHEKVSEEYDEEEVIELEFERAIKKLDTHTMHCPKCNTQVTKVILRRKRKIFHKQHKPLSLLGCLPCLSLFIPSGNSFTMFGIFGNSSPANIPNDNANVVIHEKADCLSLFRIFLNKFNSERIENPPKTSAVDFKHDFPTDPTHANDKKVTEQVHANGEQAGKELNGEDVAKRRNSAYYAYAWLHQHGNRLGGRNAPIGVRQPENGTSGVQDDLDEYALKENLLSENNREIEEQGNTADSLLEEGYYRSRDEEGAFLDQKIPRPPRENMSATSNDQDCKITEIWKSIVYGGLMQSITSLSIVVSAAASDATTLSTIALGMANVFGGLFIIGPSLWCLNNDVSNEQATKYQELLGRRENFSFHATFAILSFLLFGCIPPITYGFSFRISNNKEMKILAVVAAGLFSVVLLAFGKAYVQNTHKLCVYIKTVMYYGMMAFVVSGFSFVAGHLIKEFAEDLGLFDSSLPVNLMSSVNSVTTSF